MSIFRYAIFSLLLSVPLVGGASTITLDPAPALLGGLAETSSVNAINTNLNAVSTPSGQFIDIWHLVVDINETASIAFGLLNLPNASPPNPFLAFSYTPDHPLLSDYSGVFEHGTYDFAVLGTSPQNGVYFVNTVFSAVAAVPLPAAVWLFGTALFGFLSISKYRHQI